MAEAKHRARRRSETPGSPAPGDGFAMLFERNPVPLFVYDRASLRVIAVNGAALALYGYDREDFLEKSIVDILPPEERPQLRGRMPRAEDGMAKVGVRRHVCADGRIVHVDLLRQEFEFNGRDAALMSVIDMTGKMRGEDALRQSHEQLARAQRVSHTGSFVRDLRTDIVTWSEEALRILGLSSDGRRWTDGRATARRSWSGCIPTTATVTPPRQTRRRRAARARRSNAASSGPTERCAGSSMNPR